VTNPDETLETITPKTSSSKLKVHFPDLQATASPTVPHLFAPSKTSEQQLHRLRNTALLSGWALGPHGLWLVNFPFQRHQGRDDPAIRQLAPDYMPKNQDTA
jgi:hypothetical protein